MVSATAAVEGAVSVLDGIFTRTGYSKNEYDEFFMMDAFTNMLDIHFSSASYRSLTTRWALFERD